MQFKKYTFEEGLVPVPSNWIDQTVNVFLSPDDQNGASFTITRDKVVHGQSEEKYLEKQLKHLATNLDKFRVIDFHTVMIDGKKSQVAEIQWKGNSELHVQLIGFRYIDEKIIILTGSVNGFLTDETRSQFLGMMERYKSSQEVAN